MKKETRDIFKKHLNIKESKNPNKVCKKCIFHNNQKICQIHLLKTKVNEVCDQFKPLRKHTIVRGGNVSPR
jgi:hypothetical protein